jgi:protein-S-isoprenylcysteine O-methyltransferase Ste14
MANRKTGAGVGKIPASCTSGLICLTGLMCIIIAFGIIKTYDVGNRAGAILAGVAFVLPVFFFEHFVLKTYKRPSTGLDFSLANRIDFKRVGIKLVGLYFTLLLVAFFYRIFPEYYYGFYDTYWGLAKSLLIIIAAGAIPYFIVLDRYMAAPEDAYWKLGMIVLGSGKGVERDGLKTHFLGWLIKAFFLPLMFTALCGNIGFMKAHPILPAIRQGDFPSFFNCMENYIFTVDLVIISVGYILTLRIFDNHIRSAEPTFYGWFVALMCYQPFWDYINRNYLAYNVDTPGWKDWLWGCPPLLILWGWIILILFSIYSLGSVYFGLRFSNLTHRGIVTGGPYRFTKHPAYVSKNLAWWFVFMPFISHQGFLVASKHCLLLLMLNFVYFQRARTEERHLSKDPVYVQYALVMNEKSIFSPLAGILPFLRYAPPDSAPFEPGNSTPSERPVAKKRSERTVAGKCCDVESG